MTGIWDVISLEKHFLKWIISIFTGHGTFLDNERLISFCYPMGSSGSVAVSRHSVVKSPREIKEEKTYSIDLTLYKIIMLLILISFRPNVIC